MLRRTCVPLALAASLVALAACGGAGGRPSDEVPPAPPAALDVAPLTGVRVEDPAALDCPAVAVKVSDVPEAHPQVGVERADLVFVEPVGPAYTRLAAVFHSDLPEAVGPVRSVRPMDAALLGPLSAVFANTMGAQWVTDYVEDVANLDDLGTLRVRGSGAYEQDPDRSPPNDVLVDPDRLLELSELEARPAPYVPVAGSLSASSAVQHGAAGTSAVIPYGPSWDVTWTYDEASGRYLREQPWGPHVVKDGTQVSAANVLVLSVRAEVQKLRPGAGAPVPVLQLVDASGSFVALAGGSSVRGTWWKEEVNDPFRLVTADGEELLLAPGSTWVELPEQTAALLVG